MCKIGINIDATTPDGTEIISAMGRYRLIGGGATDWVNFNISLNTPETPDITTIGNYELEVNVSTLSKTSEWSNRATFKVSSNCSGVVTEPLTCDNWVLDKWVVVGNFGTISVTYVDCDGVTQTTSTFIGGTPVPFCAKQIISYDLGDELGAVVPTEIANFTADYKGIGGYLKKTGDCDNGTATTPMVNYKIQYNPNELWEGQPLSNWWVVYNTSNETGLKVNLNQIITNQINENLNETIICASQIVGWSKTETSPYINPLPSSSIRVVRTEENCNNILTIK